MRERAGNTRRNHHGSPRGVANEDRQFQHHRRLTNLLDWLREAEPDVACLQEAQDDGRRLSGGSTPQAGYDAVWRGEGRWNGVAILARWVPVPTRLELPGDADDGQSRYLEAAVNGVLVASIYAPNGNPQRGQFDYKLAWLSCLNPGTFPIRRDGGRAAIPATTALPKAEKNGPSDRSQS